jgi:hypothetical protein
MVGTFRQRRNTASRLLQVIEEGYELFRKAQPVSHVKALELKPGGRP